MPRIRPFDLPWLRARASANRRRKRERFCRPFSGDRAFPWKVGTRPRVPTVSQPAADCAGVQRRLPHRPLSTQTFMIDYFDDLGVMDEYITIIEIDI